MPHRAALAAAIAALLIAVLPLAALPAAAQGSPPVPLVSSLLRWPETRWPGSPLRLARGAPTIGLPCAIAFADVTADASPDLLLASPYGEVVAFPSVGQMHFAEPRPLLAASVPVASSSIPLMTSVPAAQSPTTSGLLLGMAGHLFYYPLTSGGIGPPSEVRCDGQPLAAVLRSHGSGRPLSIALPDRRALVVLDDAGSLWLASLTSDFSITSLRRLTVDSPWPTSPHAITTAHLASLGSGLLAVCGSALWWIPLSAPDHRPGQPQQLTAYLRDPDGLSTPASCAAAFFHGRLIVTATDGRLFSAALSPSGIADVRWLSCDRPALSVGRAAAPWPTDWDADGTTDLVVGSADGYLRLFLSTASGRFRSAGLVRDTSGPISVPGPSFPALADLDSDGDADLLLGAGGGYIYLWRNTGRLVPAGQLRIPSPNPHVALVPTPLDWDGDGDLDLLVGLRTPTPTGQAGPSLLYLENSSGPGRWPQWTKAVVVDVMASRNGTQADASYIAPFRPFLPSRLDVGSLVPLLSPQGVFPFRLATRGPAYPRFTIPARDLAVPLHPPAGVWSAAPASGQIFCGLEPYGLVCVYRPPQGPQRSLRDE